MFATSSVSKWMSLKTNLRISFDFRLGFLAYDPPSGDKLVTWNWETTNLWQYLLHRVGNFWTCKNSAMGATYINCALWLAILILYAHSPTLRSDVKISACLSREPANASFCLRALFEFYVPSVWETTGRYLNNYPHSHTQKKGSFSAKNSAWSKCDCHRESFVPPYLCSA